MTQPYDPNQPPPYGAPVPPYGAALPPPYGAPSSPPPYGAPEPPPYGAPAAPPPGYPAAPPYGGYGYGPPPGHRVNDPAPMGMRLLARIIDALVVGVASAIPIALLSVHLFRKTVATNGGTTDTFHLYDGNYFKFVLIGLVVGGLYEVAMIAGAGATLGKMAVGVRVADLQTGHKPSVQQAAVRWVIPAVAQVVFFLLAWIVYLSPFFDATHRNRGWYDYAARTIAVRTR
jgi:uncharacterized RDD family membrane protein YckC